MDQYLTQNKFALTCLACGGEGRIQVVYDPACCGGSQLIVLYLICSACHQRVIFAGQQGGTNATSDRETITP